MSDCGHETTPGRFGREGRVARPLRRAAARAHALTAEYATTGEWVSLEEVDPSVFRSRRPVSVRPPLRQCADSSDTHANSDTAEEVAWVPARGGAAGPRQAIGVECAAAVNLLSMSVSDPEGGEPAQMYDHCSIEKLYQSFRGMEAALKKLGHDQQCKLYSVKEILDHACGEATAADAAVGAVAKILATKQVDALKARTAATCAAKRLHETMVALDKDLHRLQDLQSQPEPLLADGDRERDGELARPPKAARPQGPP